VQFGRHDTCQTARWDRHRFLLEPRRPIVSGVQALAALIASFTFSGTPGTDLRITVWPEGPENGTARIWRLRCNPTGGTLAGAAAACRRLAAMKRPFAPVPKDIACTEIYGGPQVARVTGTLRGRGIWATFRRTDGCQIARWNRHSFLLRT
jgi:subtilisin inhibitor-like